MPERTVAFVLGGGGARAWTWRDRLRVDAVMHHGDLVTKGLREGAGLPVGGADARVGHLKVQQVVEVLQAQPAGVARVLGRSLSSETSGLPDSIRESYADRLLRIPMRPQVRSLNLASSAAAVTLEAVRQINLEHGDPNWHAGR